MNDNRVKAEQMRHLRAVAATIADAEVQAYLAQRPHLANHDPILRFNGEVTNSAEVCQRIMEGKGERVDLLGLKMQIALERLQALEPGR